PKEGAVDWTPNGDLVVTAGGEFRSIRAESEGQHGDRARVTGGWIWRSGLRQKRGERGLWIRGIALGALLDPSFDDRDLSRRQGIILLWHAILRVFRDEQQIKFASVRLTGSDRRLLAFAAIEYWCEGVHLKAAFALFRP